MAGYVIHKNKPNKICEVLLYYYKAVEYHTVGQHTSVQCSLQITVHVHVCTVACVDYQIALDKLE